MTLRGAAILYLDKTIPNANALPAPGRRTDHADKSTGTDRVVSTISYLTRIEFEEGARRQLGAHAASVGIKKPLIVTDKGIVAAGLVDEATKALGDDLVVFDGTPPNPTEVAAREALALFKENACDGLIAVGGGSPIDLAKAVALMATHAGPLAEYAAIEGGVERIGPVEPVIAVPTTAGTGSEVGRAALITLADGRKLGIVSPHIIPRLAVCDPELTLGLPAGLTAATGLDAISHCVETYLSPRHNPVAEAIALDGLVRAVTHLPAAVADGSDRTARGEMLMAALEGGLTFQKGLGAIHALSHPLGAVKSVSLHHGTLNAILLPHVLDYNEEACGAKYAVMRQRLGLDADASLSAFFADFNARLKLPRTLKEVGLPEAELAPVSVAATKDHSSATNPRPASADDYLAMMKAAYE